MSNQDAPGPSKEHLEAIRRAQEETQWTIFGVDYAKIPFGTDHPGAPSPCHDCLVEYGQYHVNGCDMEICPRCKGQLIACPCEYEGDPPGDDETSFSFSKHRKMAVSDYLTKATFFEEACKIFETILKAALSQRSIKVQSVQSRAKTPDSFGAKAATPSDVDPDKPKYPNPITEITDAAGVRVIAFVPSALELIDKLIEEEFKVTERSRKGDELIAEERFGYASNHYLVRLSNTRSQLPEYERYRDVTVEIQVRTILQHAWAEMEHDIQYKSDVVIPNAIKRKFASLAGMLEIADREFQSIQDEDQRLRREARDRIEDGDTAGVEITPDALKAFLEKRLGRDRRIRWESYDLAARQLREFGFSNIQEVERCIEGFDAGQLCKLAYGTKQGHHFTLDLMLLAGMGEVYCKTHVVAGEEWFDERNKRFLQSFTDAGIRIGEFDPKSPVKS